MTRIVLQLFVVLAVGSGLLVGGSQLQSTSAQSPIAGKIIALDAGHGGGDPGAIGTCDGVSVTEAEVNLRTREVLTQQLQAAGATVFPVPQVASRSDRVAAAEQAGAEILISIHHNGSSSSSVNYTKTFVTQKNDKDLASFVHPLLVGYLGLLDNGIKSDGYGMTVYGKLPGILTEAYFITNTAEACDFLTEEQARLHLEVQAHFDGIVSYFENTESDNGGDNGNGKGNGKGPKK